MLTLPFIKRHSDSRLVVGSDQWRFELGTRTLADLLAPAAVEVGRDHLRLDQQYARVVQMTGYPRTVSLNWLKPLIEFDTPLEISLHLYPLDSAGMIAVLTSKMVQLESSRQLGERAGRLPEPEREVGLEDLQRLRDALQRGEEKIFSVSLYVLVRAGSLSALDSLTQRLTNTVGAMLAQSRIATFEQDAGLRSCLPEARDQLMAVRNLDTSSVATMFPFASGTLLMEHGVLYGIAKHNHSPVIVDPFDPALENANMVVFATSGAGKSYFAKLLAMRSLLAGIDFFVIDPEDEYRRLCTEVGGQYIRLASSSGQHINPFDLPPVSTEPEEGRDPLAEQVAAGIAFVEVMLAEPGGILSGEERAVLDLVLYQTYAAAGITEDNTTHGRPAPLLRDVYQTLTATPGEVARGLAVRLRRYVEGSLSGLFAGPTNVALDRRLVVFNLQALEPELRPLAIHLITGFIWNLVRRVRRPRLLIIDEAWTLLRYPEGGAFLAGMARRARKYYLGLVTITQDVQDFLGSEQGRTVIGNAATKLLMLQSESTIRAVADAFRLSDAEQGFLLSPGEGGGLLFACGTRLQIEVVHSAEEHRIAHTSPRELASRDAEAPADDGGKR